jgi:hypothetical protein
MHTTNFGPRILQLNTSRPIKGREVDLAVPPLLTSKGPLFLDGCSYSDQVPLITVGFRPKLQISSEMFPWAAQERTSTGFTRTGLTAMARSLWRVPSAYFSPSQPLLFKLLLSLLCRIRPHCQYKARINNPVFPPVFPSRNKRECVTREQIHGHQRLGGNESKISSTNSGGRHDPSNKI